MRKALAIAKSNLLEIRRDFKSHGIVFILPMIFMLIFGFLFSQTYDNQTFNLSIIKSDDPAYNEIIRVLEEIEAEDGEEIFVMTERESSQEAKDAVQAGEADLGVVPGEDTMIKFYINEMSQRSAIARSLVTEIVSPQEKSLFETESIITQQNVSGFQLQSGGLIIYGILIMIPQIAGSIGALKDKHYIFRYNSSKATALDIIAGFALSSLVVGIVQALLLFYVASWFGLPLDLTTLQAFVFIIPVILFSIGAGLLIGTISPKASTGQDVGTILSIVLGFLSGSFLVGIDQIGFNIGERFFAITDIIPTFYAYTGITQLIIFEADITAVLFELSVISISALALFVVGAVMWRRSSK